VVVVWSALQAKTLVGVSAGAGPAFSRPVRPRSIFVAEWPGLVEVRRGDFIKQNGTDGLFHGW
jgi:hypothetical protein